MTVPILVAANLAAGVFLEGLLRDRGIDLTKIMPDILNPHSLTLKNIPQTTAEQISWVDNFLAVKHSLEGVFNSWISLDGTTPASNSDTVRFVEGKAKEHLLAGVALAKMILPPEEAINIYIKQGKVVIDEDDYKLDNTYDKSLAAATLETKLRRFAVVSRMATPSQHSISELKGQQNNLDAQLIIIKWLKQRNFDIQVEKDAFAFLPTDYLITLGKTFKAFEDRGLPTSVAVRFVRYTNKLCAVDGVPYVACYEGYSLKPSAIFMSNQAEDKDIAHEGGHFLADKMASFSQTAFNQLVFGNQPKDVRQARDFKEAYADAVKDYLFNGRQFRQAAMHSQDPIEQAKYNFVKQMFGDTEFVGQAIDQETYYQSGKLVQITDSDWASGIILRPTSDPGEWAVSSSDLPAVFDTDKVELIQKEEVEGLFSIERMQTHSSASWMKKRLWQVVIKQRGRTGQFLVGNLVGQTGWIEDVWFGETIP